MFSALPTCSRASIATRRCTRSSTERSGSVVSAILSQAVDDVRGAPACTTVVWPLTSVVLCSMLGVAVLRTASHSSSLSTPCANSTRGATESVSSRTCASPTSTVRISGEPGHTHGNSSSTAYSVQPAGSGGAAAVPLRPPALLHITSTPWRSHRPILCASG